MILDADGNAVAIRNLPVTDENTGVTTVYDVDFVFEVVSGASRPETRSPRAVCA